MHHDHELHAHAGPASRVLVCDDNADAAWTLAYALMGATGWPVQVCIDGASALDAICANRPDVVLMDVCMPGIDGWQASALLDQIFPDAGRPRLVAVTGLDLVLWRERLLAAGFDDALGKPVDLPRLVALLRAGATAPQPG
jgi:CheY-like chemotaxis protein